jgi:hypothetical protein
MVAAILHGSGKDDTSDPCGWYDGVLIGYIYELKPVELPVSDILVVEFYKEIS